MSEAVEFGSQEAANNWRDDRAPEHVCPEDDDRRFKTVYFKSTIPDELLTQARAAADEGKAEREAPSRGQPELTDMEKGRIDFSRGRANTLWARSIKGIAQHHGVSDWTSHVDHTLSVDEHRELMERAGREGGGARDDGDQHDIEREQRAAAREQAEGCDHAREYCENGHPEACEALTEGCGYSEEEVEQLLGEPIEDETEQSELVTVGGDKFPEMEVTPEVAGALSRSWTGYQNGIRELRTALDDAEEAVINARQSISAINAIRDRHGQDNLHPNVLHDLLEALEAMPGDIPETRTLAHFQGDESRISDEELAERAPDPRPKDVGMDTDPNQPEPTTTEPEDLPTWALREELDRRGEQQRVEQNVAPAGQLDDAVMGRDQRANIENPNEQETHRQVVESREFGARYDDGRPSAMPDAARMTQEVDKRSAATTAIEDGNRVLPGGFAYEGTTDPVLTDDSPDNIGPLHYWKRDSDSMVGIYKNAEYAADGYPWTTAKWVNPKGENPYWKHTHIAETPADAIESARRAADQRVFIQTSEPGETYPDWLDRTGGTEYTRSAFEQSGAPSDLPDAARMTQDVDPSSPASEHFDGEERGRIKHHAAKGDLSLALSSGTNLPHKTQQKIVDAVGSPQGFVRFAEGGGDFEDVEGVGPARAETLMAMVPLVREAIGQPSGAPSDLPDAARMTQRPTPQAPEESGPEWNLANVRDLALGDEDAARAAVHTWDSWEDMGAFLDSQLAMGTALSRMPNRISGLGSTAQRHLRRSLSPDHARRVLLLAGLDEAAREHFGDPDRDDGQQGLGDVDQYHRHRQPDRSEVIETDDQQTIGGDRANSQARLAGGETGERGQGKIEEAATIDRNEGGIMADTRQGVGGEVERTQGDLSDVGVTEGLREGEQRGLDSVAEQDTGPTIPDTVGPFERVETDRFAARWENEGGAGAIVTDGGDEGNWLIAVDETGNGTYLGWHSHLKQAEKAATRFLDGKRERDVRNVARDTTDLDSNEIRRATSNQVKGTPAQALAERYESIEDVRNATRDELASIDGVGPTSVDAIEEEMGGESGN